MELAEVVRQYSSLSAEQQLRVLAAFGHSLTVVARDTYEVGATGVRAPQRLRDVNEIQHRIWSHIGALAAQEANRYSDESILTVTFEIGDEHLRAQTRRAFERALNVAA